MVVFGLYQPSAFRIFAAALGLIESGNSRTPVTCSDTVLLASPRLCEIVAAFFSGKNDVPHPGPQRSLVVWTCCGVGAGKGLNRYSQSIHFTTTSSSWLNMVERFFCSHYQGHPPERLLFGATAATSEGRLSHASSSPTRRKVLPLVLLI